MGMAVLSVFFLLAWWLRRWTNRPPTRSPNDFRHYTTPVLRDALSLEQKMELHKCLMLPEGEDCAYVLDPDNKAIFEDPIAEQCTMMPDMDICKTYGLR